MGVARAFSSRRIFVDALIGLAISSLAFVIFNYGLDLSLPAGTLVEEWLPGGGDS
jgi:putative tricarboxylic transport membrane protein